MRMRKGSRVVLLNDRDEVFMFLSGDLTRTDPATGKARTYWVLPGGGVEPGESFEEAALRELWEETGIRDVSLGPCLWTRRAVNRSSQTPWGSDERFFLVRSGTRSVSAANQLPHERAHYTVSRWWSVADMRASTDIFFPEGLADLLEPVIAGMLTPRPLDLPE